jgi:5-(carboxyamino)imidazole ribonucleotide synthase
MMALEARRLGLRVAVLDPDAASPAGAVADFRVVAKLEDPAALRALGEASDVVTFETEHVAAPALQQAEAFAPVRPSPDGLARLQDRLSQRRFLQELGLAQTAYAPVDDEASLERAVEAIGVPSVLKCRRGGYDGLGQARLGPGTVPRAAWRSLADAPAVLEAFVPFERELSIVLARDADGRIREYPVAENVHRRGILHTTRVPATIDAAIDANARAIGRRIAAALGHVGVLTVELFALTDGALLVNEIAPRVHNSGHFTWGGCVTSQFEQHLRAICGLPLGDPALLGPVVMLNLLGDLWRHGEPDWVAALADDRVRLCLYGKRDARAGRKMGHLLIFDDDPTLARAERLHEQLGAPAPEALRRESDVREPVAC